VGVIRDYQQEICVAADVNIPIKHNIYKFVNSSAHTETNDEGKRVSLYDVSYTITTDAFQIVPLSPFLGINIHSVFAVMDCQLFDSLQ
jgi:hypothetical protein